MAAKAPYLNDGYGEEISKKNPTATISQAVIDADRRLAIKRREAISVSPSTSTSMSNKENTTAASLPLSTTDVFSYADDSNDDENIWGALDTKLSAKPKTTSGTNKRRLKEEKKLLKKKAKREKTERLVETKQRQQQQQQRMEEDDQKNPIPAPNPTPNPKPTPKPTPPNPIPTKPSSIFSKAKSKNVGMSIVQKKATANTKTNTKIDVNIENIVPPPPPSPPTASTTATKSKSKSKFVPADDDDDDDDDDHPFDDKKSKKHQNSSSFTIENASAPPLSSANFPAPPSNTKSSTNNPTKAKGAVSDNFVRLNMKNMGSSKFKSKHGAKGLNKNRHSSRRQIVSTSMGRNGGKWGGHLQVGSSYEKNKQGMEFSSSDDDEDKIMKTSRKFTKRRVANAGVDNVDDFLDGVYENKPGNSNNSCYSISKSIVTATSSSTTPTPLEAKLKASRSTKPSCVRHSRPCKLLQVKKSGSNKGRKFYVCALPRGEQCEHFQWAEDTVEQARIELQKSKTKEVSERSGVECGNDRRACGKKKLIRSIRICLVRRRGGLPGRCSSGAR